MRIFLSYRRDDSGGYAGRIYDRLTQHFGVENIFMDIDAIEPGSDFDQVLEAAITSCDAVVALVGKQWATITDSQGNLRLQNPHDFVRFEVETAIQRDILVIPALVAGAHVPLLEGLPQSISPLFQRQALTISDTHFHADIDYLIDTVERSLGYQGQKPLTPERIAQITKLSELTHDAPVVYALATSPDGSILASGDSLGRVLVWDTQSQAVIQVLEGHSEQVSCLTFSPDGQFLASGSFDTQIHLWNMANGQIVGTVPHNTGNVWCIAYSPDGKFLASGSSDDALNVWNLEERSRAIKISGDKRRINGVAFSPDHQWLGWASNDPSVRLMRVKDVQEESVTSSSTKIVGQHRSWHTVLDLKFSPDSRYLASASSDQSIQLWDLQSDNLAATFLGHEDRVTTIAFNPTGTLLASGSHDKTVRIWNISSRMPLLALPPQGDWVQSVIFSRDNRWLVSASGNVISIWGTTQ